MQGGGSDSPPRLRHPALLRHSSAGHSGLSGARAGSREETPCASCCPRGEGWAPPASPVPAGSGDTQWSTVCPSGALISAHIPPGAPTMLSGADKGLGESRGQERPGLWPLSPHSASSHCGSCQLSQPHVCGDRLSWERVFALQGVPATSTRVTLLFNFLLEEHLESVANYWMEDSLTKPWYL